MTSFLSSLFIFLASSAALAYPAVGDFAMMSGTATQGGMNASVTLERSIVSFDVTTDSFAVVETQTINGQAQTSTLSSKSDEMITQQQVNGMLTYCTMYSGALETITVPAGTFATCKMPTQDDSGQQSGFVWIGDVTFGIVKITGKSQGADYTLELASFRSGN